MRTQAKDLLSYPTYWAECYGIAPYLPMSRAEMDQLGWDSCDIILVTGDAYIDHPSFGMAVMGRLLESQGFRVGIISQPDWQNTDDFMQLGEPNLYFGVTAGNMDSLINRYTADLRLRSNDAYTPDGEPESARIAPLLFIANVAKKLIKILRLLLAVLKRACGVLRIMITGAIRLENLY